MEYAVLGGLVGGAWVLLFWLSIVVWVYRDIRDRTRDLFSQVLAVFLVLMFFLPGLFLYLLVRPRETLDEAYARSLEEEALLREMGEDTVCASCRRFVERDFVICPYCQTQLKEACGQCGRLLSFSWVACPYCTAPRLAGEEAEPTPAGQAAAAWVQAQAARRKETMTEAGVESGEARVPRQAPGQQSAKAGE